MTWTSVGCVATTAVKEYLAHVPRGLLLHEAQDVAGDVRGVGERRNHESPFS